MSRIPEKVRICFGEDSVARKFFPGAEEYTYAELGVVLKGLLYHRETHPRLIAVDILLIMLPLSAVNCDLTDEVVKICARPHRAKDFEFSIPVECFDDWYEEIIFNITRGSLVVPTELTVR